MPERVERDPSLDPGGLDGRGEDPGAALSRQPAAALVQEERRAARPGGERRARAHEVGLHRLATERAQGDLPFLPALAQDPDGALFQVHVVDVEPDQLRDPQSGSVQHLEDGAVSEPDGRGGIGSFQEARHVVERERVRQRTRKLRLHDGARRDPAPPRLHGAGTGGTTARTRACVRRSARCTGVRPRPRSMPRSTPRTTGWSTRRRPRGRGRRASRRTPRSVGGRGDTRRACSATAPVPRPDGRGSVRPTPRACRSSPAGQAARPARRRARRAASAAWRAPPRPRGSSPRRRRRSRRAPAPGRGGSRAPTPRSRSRRHTGS